MTAQVVERFVSNIDEFARNFWQKRPLYRQSADIEFVKSLFTLRDADAMLERQNSRPPYVSLYRDGQRLRESLWTHKAPSRSVEVFDAVNSQAIAREFGGGATIVLNNFDEAHDLTRSVCAAFQATFMAPTKAAAVVTPPEHQGLGIHYDAFDCFVAQTHGSTRWRIFGQLDPLPLTAAGIREVDLPKLVLEVTLLPGDCLYVPWGSPHYAVSESTISSHIAFMCEPVSWSVVVADLIRTSIPSSAYDSVPILSGADPSSLAAEIQSYVDGVREHLARLGGSDVDSYLEGLTFYGASQVGFINQAAIRHQISETTVVRRNSRVKYSLTWHSDQLRMKLGSKEVRFSANLESALKRIDAMDSMNEFLVGDLCIGKRAAIALVTQLVDTGVLQIVSIV